MLINDPGAWKFLLAIPIIVLLYMVRSRYRRYRVSSIMLWRTLHRDMEARQRLRWPPLSLLLLLQVLAVLFGAAALAKPALPAEDRTHLVLVVDTSASMLSTDVAPSRFQEAVERARMVVQRLEPADDVSLVQMGPSPKLLASGSDKARVMAALEGLRPGGTSRDLAGALRLAEALIQKTGGQGGVLLLSDGAFGSSYRPSSARVPVFFDPIGVASDNRGITSLEVRPDMDASGRWTAFARVSNYGEQAAEATATVTVDGLPLDQRVLKLQPRGSSDLVFGLPPGAKLVAVGLAGYDIFTADDQAEVQVDSPTNRKVLLVSKDSAPIERVLKSIPGLALSTIPPESYQSSQGADLVILDSFVPPAFPDADLLIMNPPMDAPGFVTSTARTDASVLRSNPDSPLTSSVDIRSLRLGQMIELRTPDWAHPVVEGPAGPLILQGERSGRRIVVFVFDWLLADLSRMQAFPLLLSNAVKSLDPTSLPRSVQPGQSVLLRPLADAASAQVEKPDGSRAELSLSKGAYNFDDTAAVGRYTVRWSGPKLGEISSSFNVNTASDPSSDVTPRRYDFGTAELGRNRPATAVAGQQLWPLLVLAMLGVLSVEWLYFSRRG